MAEIVSASQIGRWVDRAAAAELLGLGLRLPQKRCASKHRPHLRQVPWSGGVDELWHRFGVGDYYGWLYGLLFTGTIFGVQCLICGFANLFFYFYLFHGILWELTSGELDIFVWIMA